MTLKQLIETHVSTVFLNTDRFAFQIIRYVGGDEGNVKTFDGIPGDDMAAVDDGRGRGYTHVRSLDFASAVQLNEGDAVKVGEFRYEVKEITDPVHGMRTAKLTRYQAEVKGAKVLRNGDL